MNLSTAKKLLDRGIRISHKFFLKDEYVTKENGKFEDEKGNELNENQFFDLRKGEKWDDGWRNFVMT